MYVVKSALRLTLAIVTTYDAAGRIMTFKHIDYLNVDHASSYTYDDTSQLASEADQGVFASDLRSD